MSALTTVTTGMLRQLLTEAEAESIAGVTGGGLTEEAWLQERLEQAANRVVGAVNACSENPAIKTGLCKVPASCVHTTLVLARHAVIAALPGMSETLEGSSRAAEYNTAVQDLSRLAACELSVHYELADGEGEEGSGTFLINSHPALDFLP